MPKALQNADAEQPISKLAIFADGTGLADGKLIWLSTKHYQRIKTIDTHQFSIHLYDYLLILQLLYEC